MISYILIQQINQQVITTIKPSVSIAKMPFLKIPPTIIPCQPRQLDRYSLYSLLVIMLLALPFAANGKESSAEEIKSERIAKTNQSLPSWHPDKSALPLLGKEQAIGAYKVQVPKTYNSNSVDSAGEEQIYFFRERPIAGHMAPYLQVVVKTIPLTITEDALEISYSALIDGLKVASKLENFSEKNRQQGRLSGMRFIRSYWSGNPTGQNEQKIEGFCYLTIEDGRMITFASATDQPEALKLAENAVLTFHK